MKLEIPSPINNVTNYHLALNLVAICFGNNFLICFAKILIKHLALYSTDCNNIVLKIFRS